MKIYPKYIIVRLRDGSFSPRMRVGMEIPYYKVIYSDTQRASFHNYLDALEVIKEHVKDYPPSKTVASFDENGVEINGLD